MKRLYEIIKKYKEKHNLDIKIVIGIDGDDFFFCDIPNAKLEETKKLAFGCGRMPLKDDDRFDLLTDRLIRAMAHDIDFQLGQMPEPYKGIDKDSIGTVDNSLDTLVSNDFGTKPII